MTTSIIAICNQKGGVGKTTTTFHSDGLPMRVRAEGLVLSGRVNAELSAWVRTDVGDWLGLIRCTTTSGNRKGTIDLQQWVPSGSIKPVES